MNGVYCHDVDIVDKVLGDLTDIKGSRGGVVRGHDIVGSEGGLERGVSGGGGGGGSWGWGACVRAK